MHGRSNAARLDHGGCQVPYRRSGRREAVSFWIDRQDGQEQDTWLANGARWISNVFLTGSTRGRGKVVDRFNHDDE